MCFKDIDTAGEAVAPWTPHLHRACILIAYAYVYAWGAFSFSGPCVGRGAVYVPVPWGGPGVRSTAYQLRQR